MSPYCPTGPDSIDFELSSISTVCLVRTEKLENLRRYKVSCAVGSGAESDIVAVDIFAFICEVCGLVSFLGIQQISKLRKTRSVFVPPVSFGTWLVWGERKTLLYTLFKEKQG